MGKEEGGGQVWWRGGGAHEKTRREQCNRQRETEGRTQEKLKGQETQWGMETQKTRYKDMLQRQENIRHKKHNQNITQGHDSRDMTPRTRSPTNLESWPQFWSQHYKCNQIVVLPSQKDAKVKPCLSQSDTEQRMHALITSRLDYCNALLYGLPKKALGYQQLVQNAAAHI